MASPFFSFFWPAGPQSSSSRPASVTGRFLAQGMTWGVFSLLGIVVFVLGGIAVFFIFLARRSAVQQQSPGIGGEPLLANPHPPVTDYR